MLLAASLVLVGIRSQSATRIAVGLTADAKSAVAISSDGLIERWDVVGFGQEAPAATVKLGHPVSAAAILPELNSAIVANDADEALLVALDQGSEQRIEGKLKVGWEDQSEQVQQALTPMLKPSLDRTGFYVVRRIKNTGAKPGERRYVGVLNECSAKSGSIKPLLEAWTLALAMDFAMRPGGQELYVLGSLGGRVYQPKGSQSWKVEAMSTTIRNCAYVDGGRSLAYTFGVDGLFGFSRKVDDGGTGLTAPGKGLDRVYAPPQRATFLLASTTADRLYGLRSSTVDLAWTLDGLDGGVRDIQFSQTARYGIALANSGKIVVFDYGNGEIRTSIPPR